MKYYATADVHGYFSQLEAALTEAGYFEDTAPHKLIICGDLYDRGKEALKLQEFILDLMSKEEVILIRGNHEDLALDMLNKWYRQSYLEPHHFSNGTLDTVYQLTGTDSTKLEYAAESVGRAFLNNNYIKKIIPSMVNYYETEKYIFVHGWIPCNVENLGFNKKSYTPVENWRDAGDEMWSKARWINGMEAAYNGIIEEGKTIVCGHWHCSFGHAYYEDDGSEFYNNANFNPYYGKGVIALDACTPISNKINVIVIED